MKRQFLISLFVLFFVSGFAGAVDLQWSGVSVPLHNASTAYKQNELIVRFADPDTGSQLPEGPVLIGPLTRRAIRSNISDFIVAGATVDTEFDDFAPGLAVVKLPEGTSVLDAGIKFLRSANVLYAEPNYKYRLCAPPNDPFFPDLWGLNNTGQTGGTDDADIDAPEAWDITTGSSDIVVAVIDAGIDYDHPDLAANMWKNAAEDGGTTGVDDDDNGYIDDIYGYDFAGASATRSNDGKSDPKDTWYHGTHVAGIIGALGNNNQGVAGVCWNVKIMALKIYADDFNTVPETFASDAILAIQYAIDNGADIINFSSGGEYDSQPLKEAIEKAGDAGILFVAAVGNDYGGDNDVTAVYPASYDLDNIISVMSTDPNDLMSDFSNYGATSVDIAAPGTDIVSTTPTNGNFAMTVFGVSTNYDMLSGTSASTGYISGASALVWSHYPALPREVIKGLLMKTVDPVLTTPRRCLSGGRVNLYSALTLIPSGKPGRVINTRNPEHLYTTIQAAIDAASDGDELIAEAGTLFFEGIDFDGKAIMLRSGDINKSDDPNISPENTVILGMLSDGSTVTFANNEGPNTILKGLTISRGNADYGGGIRCDGASPTITDCIITNNTAKYYGAGIDCTNNSSPIIRNCTIANNETSGSEAIGGGINCEDSSPKIEICVISYNFADNVGGGIACYNSNPTILNCLIANNSAVYKSGGIDLENSSPVITNCTIIVDDPNAPKDGGIFAYQDSLPLITNCILWGNGDDLYNCSAKYSCIEDDDEGRGNIHLEPTFVTGPLGDYYLSQMAAGQLGDSTGIDLGDPATDPVLELDSYTTRTDGETDAGVVDMGVHYPAVPAKIVQLNVTKTGNGSVEPGSGSYRQYEVVQLKANPEDGYRIKAWTGTEDDSSKEPDKTITMITDTNVTVEFEVITLYQLRTEVVGSNGTISPHHRRGEYYREGTVVTLIATPDKTYGIDKWTGTDDDTSWSTKNTVTIDSDKEVTVLFRQPRSLLVPGQYPTITDAINAAYDHGDKVIVSAGTYPGGYDFSGKAITIASEHPDDPASVAATIIDCANVSRAFMFQSGEGHDSVVDGFTIINGSAGLVDPNTPTNTGGTGATGDDALGGAITCLNGSSPTLSNLIISGSFAWGRNGEDAYFIQPSPDPAPDPLDPLDPNAPLTEIVIDLNDPTSYDPNNVATWDPNDPWDPSMPWDPNDPDLPDPNSDSAIDGMNGENGANGLDGEPGADGAPGADAFKGGDGGLGYGGAMYFDANCAPIILHCTIVNCFALGGSGGYGGRGQDGQNGQNGQDGQAGQDGQPGQAGYNGGEDGAGGNGGNGGAGGPGGRGGDGGVGGDGGAGTEALGGAIYFGPDCRPTIRYCTILNCSTTQGIGRRGGIGGSGGGGGGAGGEGADGGAGGTGNPDGEDGTNNEDTAPGGDGGNGANGGNASPDGARTWSGAIYFGENCEVDISDTVIANNATTTIPRLDPFDPNAGGDPNAFEPGTGGPAGTDGAAGGPGTAGSTSDPGSVSTYGGGNYYEPGVKVKMTNCIIAYNTSERHDGGGEYYAEGSTGIFNQSEFIGNTARYGAGQFYDPCCSIEAKDCEYAGNVATRDGGGLFIRYECLLDIDDSRISGNLALGSGGGVYGGGEFDLLESTWYNNSTIKVEDTEFYRNLAGFGGGLYWHGEDSEVTVSYCKFDDNTADTGGGLFFSRGAPKIIGCTITNNDADDTLTVDPTAISPYPVIGTIFGDITYGGGGGIFCWSSDAKIEDCFISDNSSSGSGGGVYLGGDPSAPVLRNCLIKENSAAIDGGGIVANWFVEPTIANCSIINNMAYDPIDAKRGRGGGLSCTYETKTTLIDSILWDNRGNIGNQIAIGSDNEPIYLDRPATLTVSYSDIQDGRAAEAIHIEPGRTLNWLAGNINADPIFAGLNYLSQTQAGQSADSPCLDSGSDLAGNLGMDLYTTRTDRVADAGVVDIGYHSIVCGPEQELILVVVGSGTVQVDPDTIDPSKTVYDPDNQTYTYTLKSYRGEVVTFTATPEDGYRVKSWEGTNKDPAWNTNVNVLTVDGSEMVRVEFEQDITRNLAVPEQYRTIEEAVQVADQHGTNIIVGRGVHYVTSPSGIDFQGKNVTLISTDPDDPDVIANTIIDCQGARLSNTRAFYFHSGEDYNTKVIGFTIRNGYINGGNGIFGMYGVLRPQPYFLEPDDQPDPNSTPPRAEPGGDIIGDGYGGGILCENGSSPTIKNCVITNCTVTGAHGGDGAPGWNPVPPGYDLSLLPDEWTYWPEAAAPGDFETSSDGQWGGFAGTGEGNGYGGAIACLTGSCPIITNCIIRDNTALGGMGGDGGQGGSTSGGNESGGGSGGFAIGDGIGGGIYSDNQSCPIITDSNFVNNVARTGIGGLGGATGDGNALDPPAQPGSDGFVLSTGGIAGGAAYFGDISDANFTNCTFIDNKAYILGSYFDFFTNSDISTFAYTRGGALFSEIDNTIILKNCDFTGNLGGAVYCSTGCTLGFDDCSFTQNSEALDGGAIYIANRAHMDVNNSSFSGNSATRDGGAVRSEGDADFTDCSFVGNIAGENGGAIEAYYNTNNPEISVILRLNFDRCTFTGNQASAGINGWGGGVYFQDFDAKFMDCIFVGNTAKNGGGLLLSGGDVAINGGFIDRNRAIGGSGIVPDPVSNISIFLPVEFDLHAIFDSGNYLAGLNLGGTGDIGGGRDIGGGIVCSNTNATIENCSLSNNAVEGLNGSGGAINFYGGFVEHSIKNCLLTGNSASVDGGAISCNLFAKPEIKNCTFSENRTNGMGGAVFCDWSSDTTISDSIFQSNNNGAIAEEDFGETTVKYSIFDNNTDGDYRLYDTINQQVNTSTGTELDTTNIQADPLFVAGPFGKYYLSQLASDQAADSPALNAGSKLAEILGLSDYTTRTDGQGDTETVDIGYHFPDHTGIPVYNLTATVAYGQGSVQPTSGTYYAGMPVELTATAKPGWNIAQWFGTDNDASTSATNYVIMDSERNVAVRFEQVRTLDVPGDYTNIYSAIQDANDGDIIVIGPGVYSYEPEQHPNGDYITINNQAITIASTNPEDPCVVAATIIDGRFIMSNVGRDTILNGLTLTNSQIVVWEMINPTNPPDGFDGVSGIGNLGGGIMLAGNASPTVLNCRFDRCYIPGPHGANGIGNAGDDGWGGNGGWAGWAYGGAVYCGYNSNPIFVNCSFVDCYALGGDAGNGGSNEIGGHGGNWEEEEWPGTHSMWEQGPFMEHWRYTGMGGAVFCNPYSSPEFEGCEFIGNHAYGGSCGITGTPYVMTWPRNHYKIDSFGGAIYAAENSSPSFVDCFFSGNEADIQGPVTHFRDAVVPINYDPYISYGGAIAYEDGANLSFDNCIFNNNAATIGGAIWGTWSDLTISDSNFADNLSFHGGGVYIVGGSTDIGRTDFNQNIAIIDANIPSLMDPNDPNAFVRVLGEGGAMHFFDADVKVYDCNITRSEAFAGAGIYWAYSTLSIADCNISDSNAYHGAGLYSVDSMGTISGTTVTRNRAVILPMVTPILPTTDPNDPSVSLFDPNISVFGQGGGYYCMSSIMDITDSIFTNNEANGSGGGIYYSGSNMQASFTPLLHNSLLTGNKSGSNGGGISSNWYTEPTISNCTIADNKVNGTTGAGPGFGGGLYSSNSSNVKVIDSIIWGNVSAEGAQVAIATGTDKESAPSTISISHSDIGPRSDINHEDPIVAIAASGLGSQQNIGVPQTSGSGKLIDGSSIYRKFNAGQDKVKVIVTLTEPDIRRTTNWDDPQSLSQLRANLASRQASVLTSMTADEFTTRRTYQNVAAFSGEVSREGLNKLLTHSSVRYIEPIRYDRVMLAQALPQANALEVRHAYSGTGIAVAIVDTGVDYSHPMLGGTETFPNAKVIGGYDFGDGDSDPMPRGTALGINPVMAHGTSCAGIAAGDLGIVGHYAGGVAYDARIYALKLAPDSNDYPPLPRDAEIAAWDWCITHRNDDPTHPIKVISNSWGGGPWTDDPAIADAASPAMTTLADTAVGLGITILASSGNEYSAGQGIGWPSCMSNVISVGATYDAADMVLPYSNTDENLDILAPADPVYTTDIVGPGGFTLGDYTPNFNGTSSACPFAAGCVASVQTAAMEKIGRYLTPAEVRALLIATGDPVTDTKVSITKPRVNLAAAIRSPSGPPIYIEENCVLNDWQAPVTNSYPGWDTAIWNRNVIEEDPNFIVGYYLSQFATGQVTESNCVDGGSDLASVIGLDTRTTRIDGVNDASIVDMGYHYDRAASQYQLTVTVLENPNDPGIHGTVDPNTGLYYEGTELTLTAKPDPDYYLQGWYDANGVLISIANELDVVMDSNQVYEVRFRLPRKIEVSGADTAIAAAVNSAENGDTLVVAAGTYDGDIDFRGKEIKLVSTNPDDPNIVAETIIDCGNTTRAFTINNGEGPGTLINGFTIINGGLFADHGGAIYIGPDSSPTIVNVNISDCQVAYGGGGAIYVDANSTPTFTNVTISNCATTTALINIDPNDPNALIDIGGGGNGGGVYLNINSSPLFTDCSISGCSTQGSGGAVYSGSHSSAVFNNCIFAGNNATLNGGGIYHASDSASTFVLCMFNNNEAEFSGGGIYYNISCESEVADCNFAGNNALGSVTVSYLTDPNDPNTLVTFIDNSPVGMGGGIYCNSDSSITVANNNFIGNSAEDGGGFYLDANSLGEVVDCNIAYNTAARGAGLFCMDCPDSTIVHCSINNNEAVNIVTTTQYFLPDPNDPNAPPTPIQPGDPAFNPNDPNLIIIQNQDRSGIGQGGGIYSFAGPTLIADCQINYNTTSTSGGGIYFAGGEYAPTTLRNCLLTNNSAGRDGGGISNNWQNELEILNCTIADNSLTGIYSYGGGLYGSYDSNTVVTDSIIWDNMAGRGTQIALGSGDPADPLPSSLKISNSDIDLRVGEITTLIDPNFVPVLRPGFNEFSLQANDDLSTGSVDIGFNINYFGSRTSTLFVNNNGNVTFDAPMWTFTPFALTANLGTPVIAPFFADVDTRSGTIVTYGTGMVDGRAAFGVNWIDVGYFATHVDKLNSFQLILIDRSDRSPGDFDIEFNYGTLNWETGDASQGQNGFGGFSARAGFSHGTGNPGTYYEFEGSGVSEAFLDSNPNGLIYGSRNSSVPGRYIFTVSRGAVDIGLLDIPIYVEDGCTVAGWDPNDPTFPLDPNAPYAPWDPATNNIAADPNFAAGYYLSQIASGQDFDSPCVDIGSADVNDPGIELGDYTTRTDGVNDVNIVDLGYHYNDGLLGYRLTVEIIEDPNDPNDPIHGSVDPNDKTIYVGFDSNVITIVATPDTGYKVKKWTGTDDDTSINWTNTVTLTEDRHVTVEFEPAEKYNLTVNVIETEGEPHGTVTPTSGSYFDGQTIALITTPDPGYQVKAWTGTDDDTSTDPNNTVTINGADAHVTVEFWQPVPAIISVPGDYQRIQDAVTAAQDGDTIVVDSGVYYGGDQSLSLVIDKAIHITSRDPHDPCTVEATIIRGNFTISPFNNIGVIFASDAILNGFTIEDFGGNVGDGDDGDRDDNLPNGVDGGFLDGAGIWVLGMTSPVIKNCVIRGNIINAGDGGDGVDADADNNAGRGGWGGYAHGAGIYCGAYSSPQLINCRIENNIARGGSGGDGGDYDAQGGYANYGGNYSREGSIIFPAIDYPSDPNIITFDTHTEGHLWEIWGYNGDYRWYSGYGGGVFCDIGSNVTFESCEIRGNRTFGGMSGQGGIMGTAGRQIEPLVPYEIPSYGGGVYCAANSTVIFDGCTFEDNIASETFDPNVQDPNHRLSPYIGYGGGVSAERGATIYFADCNFVDNQADSGGGIYVSDVDTMIVDCNIASNMALRGGGFLGVRGETDIKRSIVTNNQAITDVNDPNDDDVLSIGAGLCFWSVNATIRDCTISGNRAQASGGGAYLRGENESEITNCLIINNAAGRDGGGISANWYAMPTIANCTFSGNAASGTEGETDRTGYGGALFCGYESDVTITDSILWNNFGLKGQEIAVGASFELVPKCKVTVKYSDVKSSPNNTWIDIGCILDLKQSDGNIDDDPLFAGGYYLSQAGAGQSRTSPCVNRGSDYASHVGLLGYTTRTDHVRDKDKVDMGYHYNTEDKCRLADFVFDGVINTLDYDKFAQILGFADFESAMEQWLEEPLDLPSSPGDNWRNGTDITTDRRVNNDDLDFLLIVCTDAADVNAPVPDPGKWEIEPYLSSSSSVSMVAETAFDVWSRHVEYYFDCNTPGGHSSGWQASPIYTDSGLALGIGYGYRVRARDGFGNVTEWSEVRYSGIDTIPPAPAPRIETIEPNSPTSISMLATEAYDYSDVEYYFENVQDNGHDSGWQDEPNFTDVNLAPNTEYSYRVRARDKSPNQNETDWSATVYMTTLVPPDLDPPTPDPMEWDLLVDANGVDGTPHEVYGGGTFDYYAEMTAVIAVDAAGGPVEYFFECTNEHGFNSGWILTETYSVLVGRSGQGWRFRVRARDQFGNMTAWSVEDIAD